MERSWSSEEKSNTIKYFKDKIEYNANCRDMSRVPNLGSSQFSRQPDLQVPNLGRGHGQLRSWPQVQVLPLGSSQMRSPPDLQSARTFIHQFGAVEFTPQDLIENGLANYMRRLSQRFPKIKTDADVVAKKWQQIVDQWLTENSLTEQRYLETLSNDQNMPMNADHPRLISPALNGAWNANHRNSYSDFRQNSHSSSSGEMENSDFHQAHQRNSSINHRSNHHHSFVGESSSPLHLHSSQNNNSAEFNVNLSIDPREISPNNNIQKSPVKPIDRFFIPMKENQFRAVKIGEPSKDTKRLMLWLCRDYLRMNPVQYPQYVTDFLQSHKSQDRKVKENSNSSDCGKSLGVKAEKKIDSRISVPTLQQGVMESAKNLPVSRHDWKSKYMDYTQSVVKAKESKKEDQFFQGSTDLPSTSQQGVLESSRNLPVSRHDRKSKQLEYTQSVVKAKELKKEGQSFQGSTDSPSTSQQGVMESSKNLPVSRHDRKRKHVECAQSVAQVKESKKEGQSFQGSTDSTSTSQQGVMESSRNLPVSRHDRKNKHMECTQSLVRSRELKGEQQSSHGSKLKEQDQDTKLKHMARTHAALKGRESKEEQQHSQTRTLKHKENSHSFAKSKGFNGKQQDSQESKLKKDTKQFGAMAPEARNHDKNNTKKRASPNRSAQQTLPTSKNERTPVYNGGRNNRSNNKVESLFDICTTNMQKLIKRSSDPVKLFVHHTPEHKSIAPILPLLSPTNLFKLEEEKEYLIKHNEHLWKFLSEKHYRSRIQSKEETETWRCFFMKCHHEADKKLKKIAAAIAAHKVKPDRQIKLTTVDGLPTKRPRAESVAKNHVNNSAAKPVPNTCPPSSSRSVPSVAPKATPNHIKPSHKTLKKDAPLMQKVKKTLGQFRQIRRS